MKKIIGLNLSVQRPKEIIINFNDNARQSAIMLSVTIICVALIIAVSYAYAIQYSSNFHYYINTDNNTLDCLRILNATTRGVFYG